MKVRAILGLILVMLLAQCRASNQTPQDQPRPAKETIETDEFTLVLDVLPSERGSPTHFTFLLQAKSQMTLRFGSSQRYDFEVRDKKDGLVWSWSEDRAFLQVLGEETVVRGGGLRYEEDWNASRAGRYKVLARITADRPDLVVEAAFEVREQ